MLHILKTISLASLLALVASAPALAEERSSANRTSKAADIQLLQNDDITTTTFGKGVFQLNAKDREDLQALAERAKDKNAVERLIVAAWSDQEYPSESGTALTQQDRKLAKARLASIKNALKDLGVKNVQTFSMAEHPSWIARVFNTQAAKVKGEGKIKDWDDLVIRQIGEQLRQRGGPGQAVVVVVRKAQAAAH